MITGDRGLAAVPGDHFEAVDDVAVWEECAGVVVVLGVVRECVVVVIFWGVGRVCVGVVVACLVRC